MQENGYEKPIEEQSSQAVGAWAITAAKERWLRLATRKSHSLGRSSLSRGEWCGEPLEVTPLSEGVGNQPESYWCLAGNGWEWGNGIVIDIYYESFSHSLLSTCKGFVYKDV